MSCDSFESCVVDLARGDELAAGVRDQALSHAEGCLRCAARLEDERSVTGALRAFAARTATAEAPPWVETALIRAMRAPEAGSAGHEIAKPSRAIELLLLAAAAAILAAIVMVPPRFDPFSGGARPAAAVGSPTARSGSPEVLAGENADFVALTYGEELGELESLQVVSVELPRTALAALGWPAGEGAPGESVRADVIVGYDGVARAIRFVD
jgi:hypothetical protein